MTPILDLVPLHTGQPGLRTTLQVTVTGPAHPQDQAPPSSLPSLPSVNPLPDPIRENSCNSCLPENSFSHKDQVPSSSLPSLPSVNPLPDPIPENSCNSCLDFISSDSTLDRYGEIITPAGWDLTNYRRNPVFQNAHQYNDIIFTLGRALVTEIRSGKLFQRIQFAVDANPLAKIAHSLYAGKFLNAVSVGFIPLRWQDSPPSSSSPSSPPSSSSSFSSSSSIPSALRTPHSEIRTGAPRRIYLEQELLEVSAVSIPANPNALALAVKSGAVEKSDLKETMDLIRAVSAPSPTCATSPTRPIPNLQPLLSLARQIRAQLKHL